MGQAGWSGVMAALAATVVVTSGQAAGAAQSTSRGVIVIRPQQPSPDPLPTPTPTPPAPPRPAPLSPKPIVQPIALKGCPRPFARPDLGTPADVGGARTFDRALARLLKTTRSPVVIDVTAPFAVEEEASPALQPWLAQVKGSGGLLTVDEYCQQSRGLISFMRRLLGVDGGKTYFEARRFDVIFHVDGSLSRVTQVEFRRRQGV